MIIRPANLGDVDALLALSKDIRMGMTSMPDDRLTWLKKLELSACCFKDNQADRNIFLVLEDDEGQVIGSAGIHACVGFKSPFYNYKVSKQVAVSESLDISVACETLNLVNDFTHATELTSLYLRPESRKKALGQFLSRSRFLVLSDFPEYFSPMVFAEIRGWLNEQEESPFWQNIGNKFFNMSYKKADFISAVNGSQFISDLMPRYPIYLNLLSDEVQKEVAKANDESLPAMRLLEKEGFAYRGYIDIFDAGPVLQCEREHIESLKQASTHTFVHYRNGSLKNFQKIECLVSNKNPDCYRIALLSLLRDPNGGVYLFESDAKRLQTEPGNPLNILALWGAH
ncbi:MAG: arginine N-succinyltransferase [Spongiibacteraceae bacterium]|nr:arginine N-succinyltransferase [Spongiibacteraceae bacterium]